MTDNYSTIEGVIRQTMDIPLEKPTMNRFEKIEYLQDTTSFKSNALVDEMVKWMTEDDFDQFYEHLCTCWGIEMHPNG